MSAPVRVFVSYSHADRDWLNELKLVLTPLIRAERIAFWEDTAIPAGTKWKAEIETQLHTTNVAVLLVSASFLASDFIDRVELPVILQRANKNELRLLWIAVGYSLVAETPLSGFQAVNDPSRPLDTLDRPQRMAAWVKIGETIKDAVGVSSVAGALGTIDESYNLVRSVVLGPATSPESHPIAQYSASNDTVAFTAYGTTVTVTADDMARLDKDSLELIQMYEDSMQQRFDRIKKLYPSRVLPSGDIDTEVDRQLRSLAKPMCEDLDNIINFLASMGKYLHDHYHKYRQLCGQLRS
jgi:hypothetical protein